MRNMHGKYIVGDGRIATVDGFEFCVLLLLLLFVRAVSLHKSGLNVYNRIYCIPGNILFARFAAFFVKTQYDLKSAPLDNILPPIP